MPLNAALTSAPILPTLWRLSLPNIAAMVVTALVSIAETGYVARLGLPALAGIALVFPMVMLQQMLSAGAMGGGISSAVSRAIGAGDRQRADSLAAHALIICLGLGLLFTLTFQLFGRPIFTLIGGRGEALEQALRYADVAFGGSLAVWLTNGCASVLRGCGNMKTPSKTLLAVSAVQIAVGGTFGLGLGGAPRLGMAGVALGQVAAFALGGALLFAHLRRADGVVRLRRPPALHWTHFRDILKVGALASISSLQTVLTILILTRLVASFGHEALAGYGIGTRLEFLLVPITFAIGVACVPMVGMAIGAGQVERARRVAWTAAALSAAIVGTLGLLVALYPRAWVGLFTGEPALLAYASSYFHWVGPSYGFFSFGLCLYFASQGAGRLLGPVLAGTLRLVIVAAGGYWLVSRQAPVSEMFALIALAMALFGIGTGLAVRQTRWGR